MIECKGYTGIFEFDPSIDAFHGRVIGLQDVVTFEGRSIEELRREMEESVDDYLDLCAEVGKEPERPYRGEFLVRTTPDVHRAVATAAEAEGMSLKRLAILLRHRGGDNSKLRGHPPTKPTRSTSPTIASWTSRNVPRDDAEL